MGCHILKLHWRQTGLPIATLLQDAVRNVRSSDLYHARALPMGALDA